MKRTHFKSITMTVGLICLMITAVLLISLTTGLVKGNTTYAKVIGIFIIATGACLSLNSATTILDRPKESVPSSYRKLVLGIVISTGIVVLLWLIVLFATNPGLIIRYLVGKRFEFGSGKEYADQAAALAAANDMASEVRKHLFITQLTVVVTVIVAYFNLVVTRRFIFKNRMMPIQVALYLGAFLFYIWILLIFVSGHVIVNDTDYISKNYIRVVVNPNETFLFLVLAPGVTIALSGLAIFAIASIASIWKVRRFKNEGLFDNDQKAEAKIEAKAETQVAPADDVKTRIQKLNELHDQGLISDEEYEKKKKDIIDSL